RGLLQDLRRRELRLLTTRLVRFLPGFPRAAGQREGEAGGQRHGGDTTDHRDESPWSARTGPGLFCAGPNARSDAPAITAVHRVPRNVHLWLRRPPPEAPPPEPCVAVRKFGERERGPCRRSRHGPPPP